MARPCACCNLRELPIDEKIRSGMSYAEIAREYAEYGLSPDAIERHARNHVFEDTAQDAKADPAVLLRAVIAETSQMVSTCRLTGDARGALSGLESQLRGINALLEHERSKSTESLETQFDNLPMERKIAIILRGDRVPIRLLDSIRERCYKTDSEVAQPLHKPH